MEINLKKNNYHVIPPSYGLPACQRGGVGGDGVGMKGWLNRPGNSRIWGWQCGAWGTGAAELCGLEHHSVETDGGVKRGQFIAFGGFFFHLFHRFGFEVVMF